MLVLVLVTASVHADAAAAPARHLLGADGATGPPPPPTLPVSVSKALGHCGKTHDPNTPCPPPAAHAP